MHPIATLTMNPALDLSTATERVAPTHKIRCGPPRFDPGGGGINVARVVKVLGGDATAVYPAGGPHGEMLHRALDALGLAQRVVPIAGSDARKHHRQRDLDRRRQYRFVLPGPTLTRGRAAPLPGGGGGAPAPPELSGGERRLSAGLRRGDAVRGDRADRRGRSARG